MDHHHHYRHSSSSSSSTSPYLCGSGLSSGEFGAVVLGFGGLLGLGLEELLEGIHEGGPDYHTAVVMRWLEGREECLGGGQ